MPFRRLTAGEYALTAGDLLHVDASDLKLPGDIYGSSGFSTPVLPSLVDAQLYQNAAEILAQRVDLSKVFSCETAVLGEGACATRFIAVVGERAYRRPLAAEEAQDLETIYADVFRGALELGYEPALRGLLEAMLQAPGFLYHWQLGPRPAVRAEDGRIALNDWELASRLSYLFWRSMPDAQLFEKARTGELTHPEVFEAEAKRLLEDPRAKNAAARFFKEWLEVPDSLGTKVPEQYPFFGPEVQVALIEEFRLVSRDLMQEPGNSVDKIFTSTKGYSNDLLAPIYGVGAGEELSVIDLGQNRPGLLTRAAFLAGTSNAFEGDPTKRGKIVRERVLCQHLIPPPPDIPPLPKPSPDLTVRERHEQHAGDPACAGCHALTDSIGFGFSNFDAVGGYRTLELGAPIKASGAVTFMDGKDHPFDGITGLAQLLSGSEEVRACLTKQVFRFTLGRAESDRDRYSQNTAWDRFAGAEYNFGELLLGVATSNTFVFREPAEGESVQ